MKLFRPSSRGMWIAAVSTILILPFVFPVLSHAPAPAEIQTDDRRLIKATWLWDARRIATEPDEILSFLQKNGVNLLYLQVKPSDVSVDHYRHFIRKARSLGIDVHALNGQPEWAFLHRYDELQSFVDWVRGYNDAVLRSESFTGIHLDIEPYLLPQWETDRDRVIREWKENTERIVAQIKERSDLVAGADLPFWLDDVPAVPGETPSGQLSSWMIRQFDHVTLMAYRNKAVEDDGILAHVRSELKTAAAWNKTVLVGVSINATDEGDKVSFAEKGKAEMQRQLSITDAHLRPFASYGGHAIHDYASWKAAKD